MPLSLDPDLRAPEPGLRTGSRPAELGALPEWDLSDLYPAMDSPDLNGKG